jgi:hypothetical protein
MSEPESRAPVYALAFPSWVGYNKEQYFRRNPRN